MTISAIRVLLPTNERLVMKMSAYKIWRDFYGTDDAKLLQPSTDGWLPIAGEIWEKLGDKAYLLDNYLGTVFAGLHTVTPGDAASDGDQASTVLWNAIRWAMEGGDEENGKSNPLYRQAKEYVDAHSLPYQEELTRHNLYYVALANKLPVEQLRRYRSKVRPPVKDVDVIRLKELYKEIGFLLEDFELLERLRHSIRSSFQITDVAHIFMQGTVEALLFSLTYRDNETSKQVFQLPVRLLIIS